MLQVVTMANANLTFAFCVYVILKLSYVKFVENSFQSQGQTSFTFPKFIKEYTPSFTERVKHIQLIYQYVTIPPSLPP